MAFGRLLAAIISSWPAAEEFDLTTRWTATFVRKEGKWRIAAFHASVNMFDNELLRLIVRRAILWTSFAPRGLGPDSGR